MVLHVSDDKQVHQALVDPKSIVPHYVVWDRNVITRKRLLFREIEYVAILALSTESTRASSPSSSWPWSTQTTSFSGLMSALMVPATMPVSTMGQN
jgi:hypothetical protein